MGLLNKISIYLYCKDFTDKMTMNICLDDSLVIASRRCLQLSIGMHLRKLIIPGLPDTYVPVCNSKIMYKYM